MEWDSEGIVTRITPHGEEGGLLCVFTPDRGRWVGYLRRRRPHRNKSALQLGAHIRVLWKARLEEQLGTFTYEPLGGGLAGVLSSPLRLALLGSALGLVNFLPERELCPEIYALLFELICGGEDDLFFKIVAFEYHLLKELGFGLSLRTCAVTGGSEDLSYISPKSGKAVCRAAGWEWRHRLFPFPQCLKACALSLEMPEPLCLKDGVVADTLDGLMITGHFFSRHVFEPRRCGPPLARERLVSLLQKPRLPLFHHGRVCSQ